MMANARYQESAQYIRLYKQLERKAPDVIKNRVNNDPLSHLVSALTTVKGVNTPDCLTLSVAFGVSRVSLPLLYDL